jgi:hypothetical protein
MILEAFGMVAAREMLLCEDMDYWCVLAKINHEEQEQQSECLTVGSSQELCY